MQQFAHVSPHREVERSESPGISGMFVSPCSQEGGCYSDMIVEAGVVERSPLITTTTTVDICLREGKGEGGREKRRVRSHDCQMCFSYIHVYIE